MNPRVFVDGHYQYIYIYYRYLIDALLLIFVLIYLSENGFDYYILLFISRFIEQLLTNKIESLKPQKRPKLLRTNLLLRRKCLRLMFMIKMWVLIVRIFC